MRIYIQFATFKDKSQFVKILGAGLHNKRQSNAGQQRFFRLLFFILIERVNNDLKSINVCDFKSTTK